MALCFDRGEKFAEDKDAGQACRHLRVDGRCGIHGDLAQKGYQGCIDFDCNGAGQRLVGEVYAGRDWREDATLVPAMISDFARMRHLHDLLILLRAAQKLDLPQAEAAQVRRLQAAFCPDGPADQLWLRALPLTRLHREVHAFLRTLAPFVEARRG